MRFPPSVPRTQRDGNATCERRMPKVMLDYIAPENAIPTISAVIRRGTFNQAMLSGPIIMTNRWNPIHAVGCGVVTGFLLFVTALVYSGNWWPSSATSELGLKVLLLWQLSFPSSPSLEIGALTAGAQRMQDEHHNIVIRRDRAAKATPSVRANKSVPAIRWPRLCCVGGPHSRGLLLTAHQFRNVVLMRHDRRRAPLAGWRMYPSSVPQPFGPIPPRNDVGVAARRLGASLDHDLEQPGAVNHRLEPQCKRPHAVGVFHG